MKLYLCVVALDLIIFTCNDGAEIDRNQVCNGENNCMGGEDEAASMCGGTGPGGMYYLLRSFILSESENVNDFVFRNSFCCSR